jgi:hypothetical protein
MDNKMDVSFDLLDHVTLGGEDRRFPLLREVFEKFPEMPIYIDIKINNDALIREAGVLSLLLCPHSEICALFIVR